MTLNRDLIKRTEEFLQDTFASSVYMQDKPAEKDYRLEHSYRVANIGKMIAEKEGFDPTEMVIACLLHDISYCNEFKTKEESRNHGRLSAHIARTFLNELSLADERINDICYGIAIHVDDVADFDGERTAFAETVSDADNIDRFDAYRIYETLHWQNFREMSLTEKKQYVDSTLEKLGGFRQMKLGTDTATEIWQQIIDYYTSFYEKLSAQLASSTEIL